MSETREKPTRGEHLEPWRKRVRLLFPVDLTEMTPVLKQKAITETVENVWGVPRPGDDGADPDARYASACSAAGMFIGVQDKYLLPRLSKDGMEKDQLDLLNDTYAEEDGKRYKLGSMTPRQVRKSVLPQLRDQGRAIREQIEKITKLLRSCPDQDKPIIEQI